MKTIATLTCLLFVLGSTWSYPQQDYFMDNHQDYIMDDPASVYDYDNTDGSYEEETSLDYDNLELPSFSVDEQTYAVQEGGDVDISFAVSGPTPYVPIVKKVSKDGKPEQLLFVGDLKIKKNKKYELKNNVLTIRDVNKDDAGEYMYFFEVEPVVELTHLLDVQYAPTITSQTPKNQKVNKGESVTLACEAEGNPVPKITWSRVGGHLPAGPQEEGHSMTLLDVDRHVEGTYSCKADNGIGNPVIEEMSISVIYAPEIVTEKAIISTGEGDKVELVCIVYSRPASEVTWQKDGSSVEHEPNMEETKGGHKHTLMLQNITEEMFGDYTCHAKNEHGESEATINLTDLPTPPHFTSDINGGEETSYTLTFETESYYPITEYQINYREAKTSDSSEEPGSWMDLGSLGVEDVDTKEMTHTLKYTIGNLTKATEYEVLAAVKNQNKWSNESSFLFSTKKDKPQSHASTSGSSSLLTTSTSMLVIAVVLLLN
ncbi:unnamed protein product [Meganyctiphanes norvegica]|uniref:Uncharacterized protein n=1 Tax=Meganyctiphanes norvegica TaxID=48144 RepID=A0AAV2RNA4_MEGNR